MSSSCLVRSTTASLLLGIAAMVVVLPSATLWGAPSPALFEAADRMVAESVAAPTVLETSAGTAGHLGEPTSSLPAEPATGQGSGFDAAGTQALRIEPWESPFPFPVLCLVALATVLALRAGVAVRLRGWWRERSGRPTSADIHAACALRAPPTLR